MLLNKETFKIKSGFEKLKLSIKTLTPEKSFYFYLSIVLIIILSFFAISILTKNKYTQKVPLYNQVLNVQSLDTVQNVLPLFASSKTEKILSKMLFAGLLKYENGIYKNDLASNIVKSSDGLSLNVSIRNDTRFSNGDSIISDDFLYTYKMMQSFDIDHPDRAKYDGLEFTKIDDKNFSINMKKSYSELDSLLTLGVINKTQLSSEKIENINASKINLQPITSGQFKIKSYTLTDKNVSYLKLENNNKYYNLSNYSFVNFYLNDFNKTKDGLIGYMYKNNIDLSLDGQSLDMSKLDLEVYEPAEYTTSVTSNIFFNPNKSELLSKKINREFIYKAIDRNYIVNSILMGQASTTYDILPVSKNIEALIPVQIANTSFIKPSPLSASTSTEYEKNKNLNKLTLTYLNTENNQKIYKYIYEVLLKYNIEIKANPVDTTTLSDIIKNRDFEMLMSSIDISDMSTLYSFLHSSQKNAPGLNITNYISKTFDKNIETIRSATNTDDIASSLQDMRKEFYSEYPYIPLYSKNSKIIKSKNLNLKIDNYQKDESDILNNLTQSDKETEYTYSFLNKYKNIIIKVNKIIH